MTTSKLDKFFCREFDMNLKRGLSAVAKKTRTDAVEHGLWGLALICLLGYYLWESIAILIGLTAYTYLWDVLTNSTVLWLGLGLGLGIVGGAVAKAGGSEAKATTGGFDDTILVISRILAIVVVGVAIGIFVFLTWF